MKVGRLAMRKEGQWWNAYWARSETSMDDAILLGSIRLNLVKGRVKEDFIRVMQEAFDNVVFDTVGQTPEWSDPRTAPERERSGRG
jgi:hypothetical protein